MDQDNNTKLREQLLAKDAQILALREALETAISGIQAWCDDVDKDSSWDGWDSNYKHFKYEGLPKLRQALPTPAPAVVPLAKLQDAEADAERLASALKHMVNCFQHPDQLADEALAAHEARVK